MRARRTAVASSPGRAALTRVLLGAVFNLSEKKDVAETERKIAIYEAANRDNIIANRVREARRDLLLDAAQLASTFDSHTLPVLAQAEEAKAAEAAARAATERAVRIAAARGALLSF